MFGRTLGSHEDGLLVGLDKTALDLEEQEFPAGYEDY